MTLRMFEGFEAMHTQDALDKKHGDVQIDFGSIALVDSRVGSPLVGAGILGQLNDEFILTSGPYTSGNVWIIGFAHAYKNNQSGSTVQTILEIKDGTNEQLHLEFSTLSNNPSIGGVYSLYRGATKLFDSSTFIFSTNWHYVELKIVLDHTSGSATLKVDEVQDKQVTGIDTTEHTTEVADTFVFRMKRKQPSLLNNTVDQVMDDIYVCDDAGTANNDYLGSVIAEAIVPSAVGQFTQWTPNAAVANRTRVDDPSQGDGDSTFNFSANVGDKDTFGFGNLQKITQNIAGISIITEARMEVAGSRTIRNLYRDDGSGTLYEQADKIVGSTTYEHYLDILETNPETTSAWAVAEINSGEFGYKLQA